MTGTKNFFVDCPSPTALHDFVLDPLHRWLATIPENALRVTVDGYNEPVTVSSRLLAAQAFRSGIEARASAISEIEMDTSAPPGLRLRTRLDFAMHASEIRRGTISAIADWLSENDPSGIATGREWMLEGEPWGVSVMGEGWALGRATAVAWLRHAPLTLGADPRSTWPRRLLKCIFRYAGLREDESERARREAIGTVNMLALVVETEFPDPGIPVPWAELPRDRVL